MRFRLRTLLLAGLAALGGAVGGAVSAAHAETAVVQPVCDAAASAAEQRHDLPPGLLRAIGQVESGRRDPGTGQRAAWPWTINAEGAGHLFDSPAEALAAVQALRARGVASVDVGCFQINLLHHPAAFATLEDGFDPARNADYAARFLKSLRARAPSWDEAIAAYHSATPERGLPYLARVMTAWGRGDQPISAGGLMPMPARPQPQVIRMVTWSTPVPGTGGAAGGMRVWSPSMPGQGASVISLVPMRAAPRS